ncbi:MAG: acyl-CoA thioesterase [Solirubrobacterales bacterium]|nr:acyl-CoA thioesterase [Solirubrobacterales bacterium]MBV9715274.1 acyl-CoA thioesterase [Solirubrobacterales bacterium]
MGRPFEHQIRVRYGECDAQGVVFNAHYLAFFDMNITELWRAAFGSYQAMLDRGVDIVVAHAELQFRAPARFDEELTLAVSVSRLGTTSVLTEHRIRRGEHPVVDGSLRHVFVDPRTLAKTAIPEWVRRGLAPWMLDASNP